MLHTFSNLFNALTMVGFKLCTSGHIDGFDFNDVNTTFVVNSQIMNKTRKGRFKLEIIG